MEINLSGFLFLEMLTKEYKKTEPEKNQAPLIII